MCSWRIYFNLYFFFFFFSAIYIIIGILISRKKKFLSFVLLEKDKLLKLPAKFLKEFVKLILEILILAKFTNRQNKSFIYFLSRYFMSHLSIIDKETKYCLECKICVEKSCDII